MRTEEWTKDLEGMTSTVVVQVFEEPTVHVGDNYMEELGLDLEGFPEVVHPYRESFTRAVPYSVVAIQLRENGWTHAGTA